MYRLQCDKTLLFLLFPVLNVFSEGPPEKLSNVTVHPSTILATVSWHPTLAAGNSITNFSLLYRRVKPTPRTSWLHPMPTHISPATRQFDVYRLKPNCTYEIQVWANNKQGAGEPVTVQFTTLKPSQDSDVVRHMLAGSDEFAVTAWIMAVSLVLGTMLVLCVASCILIHKDWSLGHYVDGQYYYSDDEDDLLAAEELRLQHLQQNNSGSAAVHLPSYSAATANGSSQVAAVHPCRV